LTRPAIPGAVVEIGIDALGFKGDGRARLGEERLLVPGTLPGERWRVRLEGKSRGQWQARPLEPLATSRERADPVCRHFGSCGGCALQHLAEPTYRALKERRIADALRHRGLTADELLPMIPCPPAARRRLRLAFDRKGRLGYRQRLSRAVVDVAECPIALPELERLIAPLRRLLRRLELGRTSGEIALTRAENGVDVLIETGRPPSLVDREALASAAHELDLARIGWRPPKGSAEAVVERVPPEVRFGRVTVPLPMGAFLQATTADERALLDFARAHLPAKVRLLDLFAGLGSFAFGLADATARQTMVEADPAMVEAARRGARGAGLARFEAQSRDLERRPLTPEELTGFDAVILDPPRRGAEAQAAMLALTSVDHIVMASCEPASFARDAAVLAGGGFRPERVQPVDQFHFAPEIELIASFRRE